MASDGCNGQRLIVSDGVGAVGFAHYESLFASCFGFLRGGQITYSVRLAMYRGVFARWYHQRGADAPLQSILRVAQPSSLGSFCMCSLLVAADRALELVLRQRRRAFPLASVLWSPCKGRADVRVPIRGRG